MWSVRKPLRTRFVEVSLKQDLVRFRDVVLSLAIGTSLVLVLFSLTESNSVSGFARTLLLPGAAIADAVGSGAHDLVGLLLYIGGNVIFYSAAPMLIFVFLEFRKHDSDHLRH